VLGAGLSLLASISDWILSLPPGLVVGLVFLFPALEASAFVGFVFPGEIAVILGGVVAYQGHVPLAAVIVAAVSGAIIGDSIGYFIGRRWGRALLLGTLGRLPLIKRDLDKHLDKAQAYVNRRKGSAVFFGRFTAALRVLVPGLAGMSDVHYPSFLAYNVAGGVVWGAGFSVLGYVAGASYKHIEKIAGRIGLLLLALVVVGLVVSRVLRRLRDRSVGLRAFGDRVANVGFLAWIRRRFPRQVAWLGARLDSSSPRGFALSFTVAVGAAAAWIFGGLTQDVVWHDETALLDPRVLRWVVAHRMAWLTAVMRSVTWLGSTAVIVPVMVLVGAFYLVRRRDWRAGAKLSVTLAGAIVLYDIVKAAVGRARPPSTAWIGHYTGGAFTSGHATQTVAFYGMLALIVGAGRSTRTRGWLWLGAALIALLVGASRIYLGAHWLSDVLGGYALGATWLAVVVAFTLGVAKPTTDRLDAVESGSGTSRRRDGRKAA
jgi:membrane protein DedA with SNARE-associated domain/membrane-associated phospholipid phosphatase